MPLEFIKLFGKLENVYFPAFFGKLEISSIKGDYTLWNYINKIIFRSNSNI